MSSLMMLTAKRIKTERIQLDTVRGVMFFVSLVYYLQLGNVMMVCGQDNGSHVQQASQLR